MTADQPSSPDAESPLVRIRSGSPTPEELAAVVTVLTALAGGAEPEAPSRRSAWSDPSWRLLGPATSRRGWRASGLPR